MLEQWLSCMSGTWGKDIQDRRARIFPAFRSLLVALIALERLIGLPSPSTSSKLGLHLGQALGWA